VPVASVGPRFAPMTSELASSSVEYVELLEHL
jgi:hypothetical protein